MCRVDRTDCRYCKKPLGQTNASLCSECGLWQNRLGWLIPQLNVGDLALYGTILILLYTAFQSFVFDQNADLVARPLSCGDWKAKILLTNKGNRDGIAVSPALQARVNAQEGNRVAAELSENGTAADTLVVEPKGKFRILTLSPGSQDRPNLNSDIDFKNNKCEMFIHFNTFLNEASEGKPLLKRLCTCKEFIQ